MPYLRENEQVATRSYAADQINWALGLNPYNAGMVEGLAYHNPVYDEGGEPLNIKGGICNGITAGFDNAHDIAFMPLPQNDDVNHRWRWSEQWTLHGTWLMLAVAAVMDF